MVPHNIFMENLMGARNTLLGSPMVAWITFRDKPSLSQNTLWENPRIPWNTLQENSEVLQNTLRKTIWLHGSHFEKTLGFAEHALGYP